MPKPTRSMATLVQIVPKPAGSGVRGARRRMGGPQATGQAMPASSRALAMSRTRPMAQSPHTPPSALTAPDGELAASAAAGDVDAFDELYRRHAGAAWRVAMAVATNA